MFSRPRPRPDPAEVVSRLRALAFASNPADLGLTPTADLPRVWGLIMETGYPEAVVSLVSLADGTASIYFSKGGGVIGAGSHPSVQEAGVRLLAVAERHLSHFQPTTAFPLPDLDQVRFYLRTYDGLLTAGAAEATLESGKSPLSPVFRAGHTLIEAIRLGPGQNPTMCFG